MEEIKEDIQKQLDIIKKESEDIKNKVRAQSVGYILGALGLVAGLAWNEAIKELLNVIFPLDKDTILAQFIYAIVVTVFVVMATIVINRFLVKKEKKNN